MGGGGNPRQVNTPAFFGPDEQPWWCSHSILNDDTFALPLSVVHPSQRPAASNSFNHQPPPRITQSTPCSQQDTSADYLSANDVLKIRALCATRRNFATCVMRTIFEEDVRKKSNVKGVKKLQLDPNRIAFVQKVAFDQFPVKGEESEQKAWSSCIETIDEANRRLNRKKQ